MYCCFSVSMCLSWKIICTRTCASTGLQCLVSVNAYSLVSIWHGQCAANLWCFSFFSVCMGGVWNCTENNCTGKMSLLKPLRIKRWNSESDQIHYITVLWPPLAECLVVGDVFMTTFDGRMFLQPGACQYVLAKSRSGGRFTVTLQYTTCAKVLGTMAYTHRQTQLYPFYKNVTSPPLWYVCLYSSRCAFSQWEWCWMKMWVTRSLWPERGRW